MNRVALRKALLAGAIELRRQLLTVAIVGGMMVLPMTLAWIAISALLQTTFGVSRDLALYCAYVSTGGAAVVSIFAVERAAEVYREHKDDAP